MNPPDDCSWIWRGILQTREHTKKYTRYQVANGKSTHIFHDPWTAAGRLTETISRSERRSSGLREGDKVDKLIVNGHWRLPNTLSAQLREVWEEVENTEIHRMEAEDRVIWTPGPRGNFLISTAYAVLRCRGPQQEWTKAAWNSFNIPPHSFITWLAMQGRLTTQDKLLQWGKTNESVCVLCSHDHYKKTCTATNTTVQNQNVTSNNTTTGPKICNVQLYNEAKTNS
ncbi:RNA-directed DNA polymerase (reverse transcriptase)-related family protein, partial [Thalictrum thalictroides]